MQLNEVLEENSIKAISQKTKISEENLQNILHANFGTLKKIKALGFISILEREYQVDVNALRAEAMEYYRQHEEDNHFSMHLPFPDEKRKRSKLLKLVVVSLFIYASWYFFTQFDQKHLSQLIPFVGNQQMEEVTPSEMERKQEEVAAELSIESLVANDINLSPVVEESVKVEDVQEDVREELEASEAVTTEVQNVSIVPVARLWFGVIDMQTGERKHLSIDQAYEVDVETKSWLLSTSAAPFSLVRAEETREFNDAKAHYFKIDKNG
ncbi:MAG TPA: hypothetical protein VLL31_05265, partial [Sulfurovum sp.]|nr:hypothetical protein [Sulfurovum sp.]